MKYLISTLCAGVVGVGLGLALSQANLNLAKAYNLEADRTMVDASRTYFDAVQRYTESAEMSAAAIDVCLGRVGL